MTDGERGDRATDETSAEIERVRNALREMADLADAALQECGHAWMPVDEAEGWQKIRAARTLLDNSESAERERDTSLLRELELQVARLTIDLALARGMDDPTENEP